MKKIDVVISAPIDTFSGYGARARDFVKALIQSQPDWDIKILAQKWGNTRWGYLRAHKEEDLISRVITSLTIQPDVWIQITVPNEFQKIGKYNIGVTAGIETDLCHSSWIKGCNNMDLILVSSKHAKTVLENSKFEVQDNRSNQVVGRVELRTPVEILFEGVDLSKYFPKSTYLDLPEIPEKFIFLVVGHWMQGDFQEDRKNIGYTVKAFLEAFKNRQNPPALLLKTMQVNSSILDREAILDRIDAIRRTVKGSLPNIYLLHGEISDEKMNDLYNNPNIKAMVSLTKGEGFGRPLLEFSAVNKPIIASGWSGQLDFLDSKFVTLVGGNLNKVHSSAAVKDTLLPEAKWFQPNDKEVADALKDMFSNYKNHLESAKRQGYRSRKEFSYEEMVLLLNNILTRNLPEFPKEVELTLPTLTKIK